MIETGASETLFRLAKLAKLTSSLFSGMLNKQEVRHSSIEKEAAVIVEAVRKRAHILTGPAFQYCNGSKVNFMYDFYLRCVESKQR